MKQALYLKNYNTFLDIKNKKKKIELRLDRGFISQLSPGEIIAIKHSYYILIVKIIDIVDFDLFPNVLEQLPLHDIFPNIANPLDAQSLFSNYYRPDLLKNCRIKALYLELVANLNSDYCINNY